MPLVDLNAFTAGVEPGGLTHGYEIKILVCFLLSRMKSGMTLYEINDALLQQGLVNYFELANAMADLKESGHLSGEIRGDETYYRLTPLGEETAAAFSSSLPLSVREKALNRARHRRLREKIESSNRAEITPCGEGFSVEMTISDVGADLMKLSLFLPTKQEAERVRREFIADPLIIYKGVLALLTGDLKTVGQLVPTKDEDLS